MHLGTSQSPLPTRYRQVGSQCSDFLLYFLTLGCRISLGERAKVTCAPATAMSIAGRLDPLVERRPAA